MATKADVVQRLLVGPLITLFSNLHVELIKMLPVPGSSHAKTEIEISTNDDINQPPSTGEQ
jgi:hypothetical protein